ncbi:MAG: M81 family metallopeptidase [Halolamina sp.]|uniref:M81 family metallopeptidase n=1 Tax=Halolamina sp. TaxID=1940283 RepID=UPI002FC2EF1B
MADETVLLGGFSHETNTFASGTTGRPLFQQRREYFGDEIPEKMRGTNSCEGGAIDVAENEGVDLVYSVTASATPSGIVAADAYEFYTEQILTGVEEHGDDLDGVILCLHGAMVPEGMDDGEGPLASMVREAVGPDVPIAVTLDLHGNITDELVEAADLLVAYEEYPHTDTGDTGRRAMRYLTRTMRDELDPEMHIERPPVLAMGPKQNTREGPMAEVMTKAREYEERDDIVKVNVFPGFHQADVPSVGCSVPVVATDADAATEVSREMAAHIWERRHDFIGDYPEPAEAVATARERAPDLEEDDGPIVLADVGDNPGGGGAADGTTVLRELLDQNLTNAGFAIMCDPEVVDQCIEAGVGERVTATVGGKTDDLHGAPIEDVDGYVTAITDGEFTNTGPMGTGSENHLGRTVHMKCGSEDGVSVLLTENRLQPLDAEIWRHAGIQPERLDVLVVKSMNHFRADYEPMSSEVIPINSIGLCSMDPRNFEFSHLRRPKFPLDEMADDEYPNWDGS